MAIAQPELLAPRDESAGEALLRASLSATLAKRPLTGTITTTELSAFVRKSDDPDTDSDDRELQQWLDGQFS